MATRTPCADEFEFAGCVWNNYTTIQLLKRCQNFTFRPTDICVCTFPRCGTTLTQEIVWHVINRQDIAKDAKNAPIDDRFPFLEFNYRWGKSDDVIHGIDRLESAPQEQQRLVKTHLPLSLLSQSFTSEMPKIVATIRNAKDCCHSLYRFYKAHDMYGPWPGDWTEFVDIFLRGETMCGDYFKMTSDLWNLRHQPNVLLLMYEDLVRQPQESLRRISKFLDCDLSDEQFDCVLHNCKFNSMYSNSRLNTTFGTGQKFLRKGVVGDWKTQFTVEQSERFDRVIDERLQHLGIQFQYE